MTQFRTMTTITAQFDNTTVDQVKLFQFFFALPPYLQAGVHRGLCQEACYYLAHADGVDFWVRRYLMGKSVTLHRVFWEIREFQKRNPVAAQELTIFVLDTIHNTLLAEEWYELMPRFQKARKHIRKAFQI
ncbi:hypothetical protein [Spirosoma panaciterrae]|uniref:hypothetical protein n=1 Tax=Spirosoma panaciterrae TaxID=496058 RepID=UPI0003768EC3|nr:hypothetical protein [Spirosoma panaciterrae]